MGHTKTQTEWEYEMSEKILSYTRNEIYLELRFLDIALSALQPRPDASVHTFATDGACLFFSTEQVLRVFRQNAFFLNRLYLHMVLHCLFSHLWIGGSRDRRRWNLACDIAVEYVIDGMDKKCTRRILSFVRTEFYKRLDASREGVSAAVIYRMLGELEEEKEGEAQFTALEREFYTDDHRYWPKQEDGSAKQGAAAASQKKWNKIARQTRMEQQRRGNETKEGEELLAAQIKTEHGRRSYRNFLQKFAVQREELHSDPDEFDLNYYTYGLKLYGNMPLIEPIESRETKKIREFVIVIDTSYSTNGELVEQFLRETVDILKQSDSFFSDSVIRVLQCDNSVRSDVVIDAKKDPEHFFREFQLIGGGGTDFRPAFAYVHRLREQGELLNLNGLLYFTDGKGIYPKKRPEYRTAFLFLGEYEDASVPPWAMRLRLEPEEFRKKLLWKETQNNEYQAGKE